MAKDEEQNKRELDGEEQVATEEIGNRAVKKAQERNRKKGLSNVYSKNRKIYYEYSNEREDEEEKG